MSSPKTLYRGNAYNSNTFSRKYSTIADWRIFPSPCFSHWRAHSYVTPKFLPISRRLCPAFPSNPNRWRITRLSRGFKVSNCRHKQTQALVHNQHTNHQVPTLQGEKKHVLAKVSATLIYMDMYVMCEWVCVFVCIHLYNNHTHAYIFSPKCTL